MEFQPSLLLALAAGIAISAASGLRAFLPLLGVGLAGRYLGLPLAEGTQWLRSDLALIALSVAAVVEIAADKIPVVDHALDVIGTLIRPAAAMIASYAMLDRLPAPWGAIVALALGGGALLVHAAKSNVRIGSTATTLGSANPVLSLIEDGTVVAIVVVAILIPLLALALLVLGIVMFLRWTRRRRSGRLAPVGPARTGAPTP